MNQARSVQDCRKIICKLAIKHSVPAKIISERLLSTEDKKDMLNGLISIETLDYAIKLWKEYGMCNYSDGTGSRYKNFNLYADIGIGSYEKRATNANLPPRN